MNEISTEVNLENKYDDLYDRLLQEFISSQNEDDGNNPQADSEPEAEKPSSILDELEHLTGLADVKAKLAAYESLMRFNTMRRGAGLTVSPLPLHAMFLGSPGTGKTTVAKLMGQMLWRAGVLSSGHVVVRERASLIGIHYSDEEANTVKAIEEARGGILFIDEAYQLYQPNDPCDPGRFVIESLLTALSDENNRDWMLILAGYPDEMKRMFDMNPGLKSRIPESNVYTFADFSESELMEIAERYIADENYVLAPDAREALARRLAADYEARDKTFGNARHVLTLIQTEILPAMARRVTASADVTRRLLTEICRDDIPAATNSSPSDRKRLGFR